jgi:hypothetical protein
MALDKHGKELKEGDEVLVRFRVVDFHVSSHLHNRGHMNTNLESVEGIPPNGPKAVLVVDSRQAEYVGPSVKDRRQYPDNVRTDEERRQYDAAHPETAQVHADHLTDANGLHPGQAGYRGSAPSGTAPQSARQLDEQQKHEQLKATGRNPREPSKVPTTPPTTTSPTSRRRPMQYR